MKQTLSTEAVEVIQPCFACFEGKEKKDFFFWGGRGAGESCIPTF